MTAPGTAVAVTGIGVVAPNGLGTDAYWDATLRGRSGIGRLTRFDAARYPARLAGEVTDFAVRDHVPGRLVAQTDRTTRFAIAGAGWALADADLPDAGLPEPGLPEGGLPEGGLPEGETGPLDRGVITASASGGFEFGQRELAHLWGEGPRRVSPYMSFAWFYAVNSGQLSIRHDLRGPTGVFVTEQAGGLDAIAHARRRIRKGARLMLTGGMDASLCPYGLAAQLAAGLLSERADPARAYLPFDPDANGHVPGEGGAILVLEDAARARARGAHVHGEILGHGASFDPAPATGRGPALRRAVETALADAGLDPSAIALVLADGAGTPALDRAEARAITEVFGPRGVPVTVPKTMTGRLYSGAAPLDVVTALLALRDGLVPPTVHVRGPADDCPLDLVTGTARPFTGRAALVLARGHGGFNSALVVGAAPTARTPQEGLT
ncbi:ketosynthase chain-length factor [Streptomyces sp. NPDC037389]|uniref:ketosynthase chain-length factor n=1 Tax=Streptomyces sp. NPDC037389 TaxID=3155369 RepID=UPI0033E0A1E0